MQNSIRNGLIEDGLGKLSELFPADCISWIPRSTGTTEKGIYWVNLTPQISISAVMNRLDDVCGPGNWQDDYDRGPNGGTICRLSILVDGVWITKTDGVDNPKYDPVKLGMIEALKGAAAKWGIGRYLKSIPSVKGVISQKGRFPTNFPLYPKHGDNVIHFRYDVPPLSPFWQPEKESEPERVKLIRAEIEPKLSSLKEGPRKFFEDKLSVAISLLEALRIAAAFKVSYETSISEPEPEKKPAPEPPPESVQEPPLESSQEPAPEPPPEEGGKDTPDENEFV